MPYQLGVDLGTSYTAAAISRDGVLELVSLGTRSMEIPSVAFLDPTATIVVGESAERRGTSDPTRLAREFKRRLGDPAPILVAGTPFSAEALMAAVLRSVVADVTRRQGEPPAHVTLTRPANWGPYKQELFSHIPGLADVGASSSATEPEAVAVHFASTTRVSAGQSIAVYDLGGGTFDAAVLRKTGDGFTTLGIPEGIEHLGGADFDDAVFEYVRRAVGPAFAQLDPTDPRVRTAAARLRAECVLAKESLSRDTEVTIPVALPGLQTEVRLTRQDFEDLVRPALMSTVESLRHALRSAKVPADEIVATVLAGGSSRIPLAAELITGELRLPVAVGTHPKHTVALGAAVLAERNYSLNQLLRQPAQRQENIDREERDRPATSERISPGQPTEYVEQGWTAAQQANAPSQPGVAEPIRAWPGSVPGATHPTEENLSPDAVVPAPSSIPRSDPSMSGVRKSRSAGRPLVWALASALAVTVLVATAFLTIGRTHSEAQPGTANVATPTMTAPTSSTTSVTPASSTVTTIGTTRTMDTTRTSPTTSSRPTVVTTRTTSHTTSSTPPTSTSPAAPNLPSGLSPAEQDLWIKLPMSGVDPSSCVGYSLGEHLTNIAVDASLQCDIADATMEQPITYYQFPSSTALTDYLELRESEVETSTGDCKSGQESITQWTNDGTTEGQIVCVDNFVNGVEQFKIVFSYDADNTVAVVQAPDSATVLAWWEDHALGQFEG